MYKLCRLLHLKFLGLSIPKFELSSEHLKFGGFRGRARAGLLRALAGHLALERRGDLLQGPELKGSVGEGPNQTNSVRI